MTFKYKSKPLLIEFEINVLLFDESVSVVDDSCNQTQ